MSTKRQDVTGIVTKRMSSTNLNSTVAVFGGAICISSGFESSPCSGRVVVESGFFRFNNGERADFKLPLVGLGTWRPFEGSGWVMRSLAVLISSWFTSGNSFSKSMSPTWETTKLGRPLRDALWEFLIEVSPLTLRLRRFLKGFENLDSDSFELFLLVDPSLLGIRLPDLEMDEGPE